MAGIVAYMLVFLSGVSLLYGILIVLETRRGTRVLPKFRSYLDRKTETMLLGIAACGKVIVSGYRRVSGSFIGRMSDAMHPVTDVRRKMHILRTGKADIAGSRRKASSHLRTLRAKK